MYQDTSNAEPGDHHNDPEQSDEPVSWGNVDQTMDGGSFQELFENTLVIHDNWLFNISAHNSWLQHQLQCVEEVLDDGINDMIDDWWEVNLLLSSPELYLRTIWIASFCSYIFQSCESEERNVDIN